MNIDCLCGYLFLKLILMYTLFVRILIKYRICLMKKYLIPIIIILATILSGSALKDDKIPNSRIKMLNGEYAKLSDFNQDGPMIVNFWTTW